MEKTNTCEGRPSKKNMKELRENWWKAYEQFGRIERKEAQS
jgi:hypothetical protein